jgi:NifU-like protein
VIVSHIFQGENAMWNYTQAVHDHFLHPHNAGPLADANAIGEVGSIACGDALKLYLKVSDQGLIENAGFETFGCASAIASSSVLTDMIKGKTVDDALKLTNKDIAGALGGLPKEKMHCSVMGQEALEAAIRQWKGEPPVPHAQEEGRLVCKCFGVTDAQIIRAVRENGLKTLEEVTNYTKAGGACGDCQDEITQILAAEFKQKPLAELKPRPRLTNVQRMQQILKIIDEEIRPQLAADGGDIELVDVDGRRVMVSLRGRCSQCRSSDVTIRNLVERLLREHVEPDLLVEEIQHEHRLF